MVPEAPFLKLAPNGASTPVGPDFTLDDRWNQAFTWHDYNGRTVCRGEIPKWNPQELAGAAYLSVGSTNALSPFQLAACPFPREQRLFVAALLEFYVAAFGVFLFLRAGLGLSNQAAGLGGLVFALSGTAIAYSLFTHGFTGSWIGFLALLALAIRRSATTAQRLRWGALYAVVVALCGLSGQPEMLLITAGGAVAGAYLVRLSRPWKDSVAALAVTSGFSLAGAALAAVQVLPTALHSLSSELAQSRVHQRTSLSALRPGALLEGGKDVVSGALVGFLEPAFQGPPRPGATLASPLPWSRTTLYVGSALLAAVIAIATALASGRIAPAWPSVARSLHVRFLLAAAVAMLVSLKFPVSQLLLGRLPIVSRLDVNLLRWLAVFFLAVLAALAFQTIAHRGVVQLFLGVLIAVNVVLATLALALRRGLLLGSIELKAEALSPSAAQWEDLLSQTWRVHLVVAALGATVLVIPRLHKGGPLAAVVLVTMEMVGVQGGTVNRWAEVYPTVDAVRSRLSEVRQSGQRVVGLGTANPTLGILLDVPALSGYTVMSDSHVRLAESLDSCKVYVRPVLLELCGWPLSPRSVAEFGNVGWVLGPQGLVSPELSEHERIGDLVLYRSTTGLGEAFFVRGSRCELLREAKLADMDRSLKVEPAAVVSRTRPASMSISFDQAPHPRCLFVSQSHDEGWTAENARGQARRVTPLAGVWQGIDVGPRDGGIRMTYDPPGYSMGLMLSLIAVALLLLGAVVDTRRIARSRSSN